MKKQGKGGIWWLLLLLVAAAGIVIGYWIGKDRGIKETVPPKGEQLVTIEKKPAPPEQESETQEAIIIKEIKEPKIYQVEYNCERIEKDIREFFKYLNKKDYIHTALEDKDAYEHFIGLIARLSSNPPTPAGEGMDPVLIIKNIFHFFRVLDKKDLDLIKDVMKYEADSLEINLDLFYKWFTMGDYCPEKEDTKPGFEVLYHHAGYILNSIGGRAYLYRRPAEIRILINYYCLLIIHEADKKGINNFGIDIFPRIAPLANEMSILPDLHFQDDYIQKLTDLQNYYLKRR
ncbi:hypothetical protein ACFL9T_03340 [Thermodesulfobacteriota bacterium]